MQPSQGRLCTFWLAALCSSLESAKKLDEIEIPMLHVRKLLSSALSALHVLRCVATALDNITCQQNVFLPFATACNMFSKGYVRGCVVLCRPLPPSLSLPLPLSLALFLSCEQAICHLWSEFHLRSACAFLVHSGSTNAVLQVACYMWTYTGVAVPAKLQGRLVRACAGIAQLPVASGDYSCDPVVWLRNLVSWVVGTDAKLLQLGMVKGIARQNGAQVAVQPTVDRMPMCEVLTFFRLIDRMQHAGIEQSANSASEKDAMLSVTMSLRGHGLAASPYGIMCARTSVERVLNNWLDKGLQQLILEGQAIAVAQVASMQYKGEQARAIPRSAPEGTERYAKWPQTWTEGTFVATFPNEVTATSMTQIAAKLTRKGGRHMPVCWVHRLPNELLEQPVPVKGKDFQASQYYLAGGWEPAKLPQQVRSVQVNTVQELQATQQRHAWFIVNRFGGPFVRAQEIHALMRDLRSLQLEPLTQ